MHDMLGVPEMRPNASGAMKKLLVIGLLTVLTLWPLAMVNRLIRERVTWKEKAVEEITFTWGRNDRVTGPVLAIPYRVPVPIDPNHPDKGNRPRHEIRTAFFLPDSVTAEGTLDPVPLHRGIHRAVVYKADLAMAGSFGRPAFEGMEIPAEDILWERAAICLDIPDPKGLREAPACVYGGSAATFSISPSSPTLLTAPVRVSPDGPGMVAFTLGLRFNGSGKLQFSPAGRQTRVRLTSSWPDPSFTGAYLPTERKVSEKGFEARWEISSLGGMVVTRWDCVSGAPGLAGPGQASFGVDLMDVVDSYRLTERSVKYGILFVVLVFTAFFLFEVVVPLLVHPIQYILVGAALCLFYIALLALSEVIPFGAAYFVGALASSLLITGYSASVLKSLRRALAVAGELAAVFGFLYVVLRLQDYSLLLGTAGLFVALAAVMFLTRNIDWYGGRV